MTELTNDVMLQIQGGASITGTFLNSLIRGISSLLELGRSVGTAIRRIGSHQLCSF